MQNNPLYVALDTADLGLALALAGELGPYVGRFKVGLEFVSAHGPAGVRQIVELGRPVFLDVKLHDIPTTVAGAVRALAQIGVAIVNVHTSGGIAMMRAAKQAAGERMKVIGVTILTALGDDDMADIGMTGSASARALRLAQLAQRAGLDGVVCGAPDLARIRAACGPDFLTAVPGSRPTGAETFDQKRFMTPQAARAAGADIVILGRPVTGGLEPPIGSPRCEPWQQSCKQRARSDASFTRRIVCSGVWDTTYSGQARVNWLSSRRGQRVRRRPLVVPRTLLTGVDTRVCCEPACPAARAARDDVLRRGRGAPTADCPAAPHGRAVP